MEVLIHASRLEWTDREVLEFMGVALRNVDIVGDVRISEIRQGLEMFTAGPVRSDPVVTGGHLVDEQALLDLASSACQEALSFGVGEMVFAKLGRAIELRSRRAVAPLLAELDQLRQVAELAAKKLRSAELCHPRAVDCLVDEARQALSAYLPEGWPVRS